MVSEELKVLKVVIQRLDKAGINYIVSGSIAANFYAQPRMTRDIDLVIELSNLKIDEIYNLFKDEFYIDRDSIVEAINSKGMFNIIHNEKVIKVDFIIAKDSDYEKLKFQRKILKDIKGTTLSVISPEDLILSKLLWARDSHSEMQINDVKNIIFFNKNELDFGYLANWADRLSIADLLEECLSA